MEEKATTQEGVPDEKRKLPDVIRQNHRIIIIGVLLVSALVLGYWWFFVRGWVETDDAYVKADSARITGRVSGTVAMVLVESDQAVEKGDILLELDPTDYQVAVDAARASLERLESEIRGEEAAVLVTESSTSGEVELDQAALQETRDQVKAQRHRIEELGKKRQAALAELNYAEKEFKRFEALFRKGSVSENALDSARARLKTAEAEVKALDAGIDVGTSALNVVEAGVESAQAQLKIAQGNLKKAEVERHKLDSLKARRDETRAQLEQALLNLKYCTIKAPIKGHVARKSVQVGDRLVVGQPVMAVVPLHAVYVEANFKETQLEHVRVGQPVKITADMYPDFTYSGRVAGIRAGTGAAFSLLPPENATGNWIKVVQRVPVKIEFDRPLPKDHALRVGLSLTVAVDVRPK